MSKNKIEKTHIEHNVEKIELDFKVRALKKFVIENKIDKVNSLVDSLSIPDISEYVQKWDIGTLISLLEIIKNKEKAEILYNLPFKHIAHLIQNLSLNEIRDIFDELYVDEIVDILHNQSVASIKKVYSVLPKETLKKVKSFLKYPQNTAGYNMTVDYIKVNKNYSVSLALESIKTQFSKNDSEIVGYIFVVDEENILQGMVRSEVLISSPLDELVDEIMEETPFVHDLDELHLVKQQVEKYEQSFLPVVSDEKKLLGVIGAEDFIQNIISISDTSVSDGGVHRSSKPYSQETSWDLFRSRIFWIILLLVIGSISQIMIIGFQLIWQNAGVWSYNDVAAATGLSSIITLGLATSLSVGSSINDASGNSGSQSSSTIIRALATKDIDYTMYRKILKKEFTAGILIGLATALTSIVRMWAIWGIMGQYSHINSWFAFYWYMIIALIASFSFFVAIVIGNLIGTILPLVAAKFGKDAALFSGPLQTTIVDILTFLVYLSLTTAVFVGLADTINAHDPNLNPALNQTITNLNLDSIIGQFQLKSNLIQIKY